MINVARKKLVIAAIAAIAAGGASIISVVANAAPSLVGSCEDVLRGRVVGYERLNYVASAAPLDETSWVEAASRNGAAAPTSSDLRDAQTGRLRPTLLTLEITYRSLGLSGRIEQFSAHCEYVSPDGSESATSRSSVSVDGATDQQMAAQNSRIP